MSIREFEPMVVEVRFSRGHTAAYVRIFLWPDSITSALGRRRSSGMHYQSAPAKHACEYAFPINPAFDSIAARAIRRAGGQHSRHCFGYQRWSDIRSHGHASRT